MNAFFKERSPEELNKEALERVEELRHARFEVRWSSVVLAALLPTLVAILELTSTGAIKWFLALLDVAIVVSAWFFFTEERNTVAEPEVIAAKTTRIFKIRGRGRGYQIHYAFLAGSLGYTGDWHAQLKEGKQYSTGMLVPVLYQRSKCRRARPRARGFSNGN